MFGNERVSRILSVVLALVLFAGLAGTAEACHRHHRQHHRHHHHGGHYHRHPPVQTVRSGQHALLGNHHILVMGRKPVASSHRRHDPPPPTKDGDDCWVTVYKQRCYSYWDGRTMRDVCDWYPTQVKGKWNAKDKCCEIEVHGFPQCVPWGDVAWDPIAERW